MSSRPESEYRRPGMPSPRAISVLMVGAGEYNCGYVPTNAAGAAPDKPAGVVGLSLLDLQLRGKVGRVLLADADGRRIPHALATMRAKVGAVYAGLAPLVEAIEAWPKDATAAFDPTAAEAAMDTLAPGDAVIVFTPDPTHFAIASAAIKRRLHVLVAKPVVKVLSEHLELEAAARDADVICAVEYHKRWDPIYADARERARLLGPFAFFSSLMTQRRVQLETFAPWAGKSSDISYYLNSHHMDVLAWILEGRARPEQVTASASTGVADALLGRPCEDTITLLVQWRNGCGAAAHSTFTASWAAPTADCHTQQNFHYLAHKGEIRADQAHRGYALSADAGAGGGTGALASLNPLYMRYTPDEAGRFAGQQGYGYRSIEAFVDAATANARGTPRRDAERGLATIASTLVVTAMLEAGRRSLDAGGRPVRILYEGEGLNVTAKPSGFEAVQ